jgi:hypothetical protein
MLFNFQEHIAGIQLSCLCAPMHIISVTDQHVPDAGNSFILPFFHMGPCTEATKGYGHILRPYEPIRVGL